MNMKRNINTNKLSNICSQKIHNLNIDYWSKKE